MAVQKIKKIKCGFLLNSKDNFTIKWATRYSITFVEKFKYPLCKLLILLRITRKILIQIYTNLKHLFYNVRGSRVLLYVLIPVFKIVNIKYLIFYLL